MQYMLLIHTEEGGWDKLTKAEQEQGIAAYTAYARLLKLQALMFRLTGCNQVPQRRPCASKTERQRFSMAPMRKARSSSPDTIWLRPRTLMRRLPGLRNVPELITG